MNRKMLIALAIVELILVGSLIAIGSSNTAYTNTSGEGLDDTSLEDCNNCDGQCDDSEKCNSQRNNSCNGTGICSQNREITKNCNPEGCGKGLCSQSKQRIRSCNSESGCSG